MRDAIFDLDGTIIDSAIQCASIGRAMRVDRGGDGNLPLADVKRLSSQGGLRLVAGMLGPYARSPQADLLEFRDRYAVITTSADSLFPGARDALEELRASGIRLSICSAKPQVLCEQAVEDVGLTSFFAAIVGSDPARPCKPDAAHLNELIDLLPGSEAACYVGDSEVDAAFADTLDLPLIMVPHGYAAEGFDFSDRRVAPDFTYLPAMVMETLADPDARPVHSVTARALVS